MTEQQLAGGRFVDHWIDMPEWGNDRRLWSFYLTFEGVDVLRQRVAELQACLTDVPGLDRVEAPWLHLTLLGTIFADEMPQATLAALERATSELAATESPFELRAAGMRPCRDALLLDVATDRPLVGLRDRLKAMTTHVVGRELYRLPEPPGGFQPHVTVAYARADAWPIARIEERYAGRPFPPIRFEVRDLALVRLRRGSHDWTWNHSIRFPFSRDA